MMSESLTGSREKPPMSVGGWGPVRNVSEEMVLFEPRGTMRLALLVLSAWRTLTEGKLFGLFLFLLAFGDRHPLATHTVGGRSIKYLTGGVDLVG